MDCKDKVKYVELAEQDKLRYRKEKSDMDGVPYQQRKRSGAAQAQALIQAQQTFPDQRALFQYPAVPPQNYYGFAPTMPTDFAAFMQQQQQTLLSPDMVGSTMGSPGTNSFPNGMFFPGGFFDPSKLSVPSRSDQAGEFQFPVMPGVTGAEFFPMINPSLFQLQLPTVSTTAQSAAGSNGSTPAYSMQNAGFPGLMQQSVPAANVSTSSAQNGASFPVATSQSLSQSPIPSGQQQHVTTGAITGQNPKLATVEQPHYAPRMKDVQMLLRNCCQDEPTGGLGVGVSTMSNNNNNK